MGIAKIGEVADFYTRLAQVTPYWDFSYSSVSFEPRYFYDETHFRNCVGEMALARIFGDDSLYIPDDFGVYVTSDNVQEHLADMAQAAPLATQSYTAEVPVLMYHHIDQEGNDSTAIVRLEQLYPNPRHELKAVLENYPDAELYWVQDEPANQGPWSHLALNLFLPMGSLPTLVSRPAAASPSTGRGKDS